MRASSINIQPVQQIAMFKSLADGAVKRPFIVLSIQADWIG